jgi:hypothetical protein
MRILEVIPSPGTHLGQERLGGPAASMGRQRMPKPVALAGHLAEPTLGWPETPSPKTTTNGWETYDVIVPLVSRVLVANASAVGEIVGAQGRSPGTHDRTWFERLALDWVDK